MPSHARRGVPSTLIVVMETPGPASEKAAARWSLPLHCAFTAPRENTRCGMYGYQYKELPTTPPGTVESTGEEAIMNEPARDRPEPVEPFLPSLSAADAAPTATLQPAAAPEAADQL